MIFLAMVYIFPILIGTSQRKEMHRVSNGLSVAENKKSHEILREVLASTYILYTKTLSFHWHVVGPQFHSLHGLFEEQYDELFSAVDELAERIRAIGHLAPANCADMLEHSIIDESEANMSAEEMIGHLTGDHFKMAQLIRKKIVEAEKANDHVTADIMTSRLQLHEKAAWILQSHLL